MEADGTQSSPAKTAVDELIRLRSSFREAVDAYVGRIDSEIAEVQDAVAALEGKKKIPGSKMRDLRDMLTLLRNTQIKSEKGRRKDIKRIDSLVGDLQMLVEHW
jgi:hypothetical protein